MALTVLSPPRQKKRLAVRVTPPPMLGPAFPERMVFPPPYQTTRAAEPVTLQPKLSPAMVETLNNLDHPCKAVLSSDVPTRRMGQSGVHSAKPTPVLSFADVKFGPQEAELKFRLIHLWEARNPHSKTLIGLEMLLIDEQGTGLLNKT